MTPIRSPLRQKAKKVSRKNSRGNKYAPELAIRREKRRKSKENSMETMGATAKLATIIDYECKCTDLHKKNCLLEQFRDEDTDSLIANVMPSINITKNMQTNERDDLFVTLIRDRSTPAPGGTFTYNYQLVESTTVVKCQSMWRKCLGISSYKFKAISKGLKKDWNTPDLKPSIERMLVDSFVPNKTYSEVDELFASSGTQYTPDMVTAAMTSNSNKSVTATAWLRKHFNDYCCHDPVSTVKKVSVSTKKNLYKEYKKDMIETNQEILDENTFKSIWRVGFPDVIKRDFCGIFGKCLPCTSIAMAGKSAKTHQEKAAVLDLWTMHKGGCFMLERLRLEEVKLHVAEKNRERPGTAALILTDGADSFNNRMPYEGTASQFPSPLTQHLQLVLDHVNGGFSENIRFNYERQQFLERWFERYGRYPEELYIQFDGGSENANDVVLAICYWLVVKRICRIVVVARMPTGHTHNEGDGVFGRVNRVTIGPGSLMTLDLWKEVVEESNAEPDRTQKIFVHDYGVIPDYAKVVKPFIDPSLGRYAKEDNTKHCWRFEAAARSPDHPDGARCFYRDYVSDEVQLVVVKDKQNCISRIGQLTGIEVITHFSRWYPIAGNFANRPGIDGMSVLMSIPKINVGTKIPPAAFSDSTKKAFDDLYATIRSRWSETCPEKLWWEDWRRRMFPNGDYSAEEYIRNHAYEPPLNDFFFEHAEANCDWGFKLKEKPPLMSHPADNYADRSKSELYSIAQPSVTQSYSSDWVPSRKNICNKEHTKVRVERFKAKMGALYASMSKFPVSMLTSILSRRIDETGLREGTSNLSIANLVKKIAHTDATFIMRFHRELCTENKELIHYSFHKSADIDLEEILQSVQLASRNNSVISLRRDDFMNFEIGMGFTLQLMNYLTTLFQQRDDLIVRSYPQRNGNAKYRPSLFLGTEALETLDNRGVPLSIIDFDAYERIYIPVRKLMGQDGLGNNYEHWSGVIIDLKEGLLKFVIPSKEQYYTNLNEVMTSCGTIIKAWMLANRFVAVTDMELTIFKVAAQALPVAKFADTGLYLLAIFDFLYHDCPVYLRADDFDNYRELMAYSAWLGRVTY